MQPTSPAPNDHRGIPNALDHTVLHRLLSLSQALTQLPAWAVIAAISFDAALAGVITISTTGLESGLTAAAVILIAGGANALMLVQLPRSGRSWGDPKPSLLALTALQAVIAAVLASLYAPLILIALVTAGISALAFYATWIEPFRLTVTHESLTLGSDGGKIVLAHVGDLHLERISPRERKVNALLAENPPDVLLFSGDFVNISYTYDAESERQIRELMSAWRAHDGILLVPGTPQVEPLDRVGAFTQGIDGLRLLLNRWHTLQTSAGTVHVLGLITTHNLDTDRTALREAMTLAPTTPGLRILLTHSPDLIPQASEAGFHLYLCGHTHGGQIRLPLVGAIMSGSQLGRKFSMGRQQVGAMTVYITRGLGMEGFGAPRARFMCPPEIIYWEINL